MAPDKIVGKKILKIIYSKYDNTLSKFTSLHNIEDQYNIIRQALNGTTQLTFVTALYVLGKLYSDDMAVQKLSEILRSIVEYKED